MSTRANSSARGGNLEETVTKNNLEAAEEIVRQLRLRDVGGIIVIDFIDMVLESNRDLVLRRLVECLSRDRTKHQVAEVTSLGLVQMTRKKLGLGLLESFSELCEVCAGRGIIVHHDPVTKHRQTPQPESRRGRGKGGQQPKAGNGNGGTHAITEDVKNALAKIAASTIAPIVELGDQELQQKGLEPAATDAAATDAGAGEQDSAAKKPAARKSAAEKAAAKKSGTEEKSGAAKSGAAKSGAEESGTAKTSAANDDSAGDGVDSEPAAGDTGDDSEETVAILDIPVKKSARAPRRISTQDAAQLLDSVLEALPEPAQPGTGRSRTSRRASSAQLAAQASGAQAPSTQGSTA
jgi:ribonuclease E